MKPKLGEYGPVALFGYYDDEGDRPGSAIVYLRGGPGDKKAVMLEVPRKLLVRLPYGQEWPDDAPDVPPDPTVNRTAQVMRDNPPPPLSITPAPTETKGTT